ncbi:hypothetical protein ACLB2K_067463 [Fragaria x ananassa]
MIRGVKNDAGEWCTHPSQIHSIIYDYFSNIFTSENTNDDALQAILDSVPTKVTSEMNMSLLQDYSDDEFKASLFAMHPSKSPGPDGYAAKTWLCYSLGRSNHARYLFSYLLSILLNGQPTDIINPTRGIRQGDPLSSYLFILCAEGLSALISRAIENGIVRGLKMSPSAPVLHHLFFADDSFIFGSASEIECHNFRHLLNVYAAASGQKINYQKSSVVFSSNVAPQQQVLLADVLQVTKVTKHDKYLGLPLRVGRSKTAIFAYIKENLTNKLTGWKSKLLASAGKETLIKAVAQTMPLYAMHCYLLSKSLCDDIHQLCAGFFWGDDENKKKIHWRSWERLCLTKDEGGLGFKNLYAYNLAMLAKQAWRMVKHPDSSVEQVFKARYHPYCSFWEANLSDQPSFSWRSILQSRPVLTAGVHWKVGNGEQKKIWEDDWIPGIPKYRIHKPSQCQLQFVQELMHHDYRTWNEQVVSSLFSPDIAQKICNISQRVLTDRLIWKPSIGDYFTSLLCMPKC